MAANMYTDPITFALEQLKAQQAGIVPPPAAQPMPKRKQPSTLPPKAQPTASDLAPEVQAYMAEKYPGAWPVKLAKEPDYTIDPALTEASQKLDSELAAKPEEKPATLQTTASQSSFRLDPQVKDYLEKRYADRLETLNKAELFANLGDAWAAKPINSTLPWFKEQRTIDKDLTLGEIDRAEDRALKEMTLADSQLFKQLQLAQMAAQARNADELKRLQILTGMDQNAAQLGLNRDQLAVNAENNKARNELDAKRLELDALKTQAEIDKLKRSGSGGAKAVKLRDLPAGETAKFGSAQSAISMLDSLEESINANKDIMGKYSGRFAGLGAWVGTDDGKRAEAFNAQMLGVAQLVGSFMEGGKLAAGDDIKYRAMLPNLTDSEEVARRKIQLVKNMVAQKAKAERDALRATGFNVDAVAIPSLGANPNAPNAQAPAEDDAAAKAKARQERIRQLKAKQAAGK